LGQAGTPVRDVMNDAERECLVGNVVGHLLNGVSEPVLQRAFEYWRNIDRDLGDRIEKGVRQRARPSPASESRQPDPCNDPSEESIEHNAAEAPSSPPRS
jgi:catalase